jgi:vanillate O-demethylase monooxygenase subunit
MMRPIHIITPETEHSSHYIWAVARNFRLDDEKLDEGLWTQIDRTFKEDRELLETQDARLQAEGMPKVPQLAAKIDAGPVAGRRLLDAMIRKEAEDPRYCAPPIPLADDDVVTQPFAVAAE